MKSLFRILPVIVILLPFNAAAQMGYGLDDVQPSQSFIVQQPQQQGEVSGFEDLRRKLEADRQAQLADIEKNNEDFARAQMEQISGNLPAPSYDTPENNSGTPQQGAVNAAPVDTSMGGILSIEPSPGNSGDSGGDTTMGGILAP